MSDQRGTPSAVDSEGPADEPDAVHPLLAPLSQPDAAEVTASTALRCYERGDTVLAEGDPPESMHLLLAGHVAIQVVTELGDVAMLRVLGPGDFFGELSLVSPAPRNASVVALDEVSTRSLSRRAFEDLRRRSPAAERLLVEALVAEDRRLSDQVRDAYYLAVPERTVGRLVELCSLYPAGRNGTVVVPFTQEELAQLVGTARPTLNKVLKDLEARGLIRITRGRVAVVSPDDLAAARPGLRGKRTR